ncbi:MAG: hypothetical protein ABI397_03690 [Candidatus Saccharimonas sp.]
MSPKSSKKYEASLSDEYKEKRAAAKERFDNLQSISDLVTVDGAGGVHIPRGSGHKSGRYMSYAEKGDLDQLIGDGVDRLGHKHTVHEGLEERERENGVYNQSRDLVPFVDQIGQAIIDATDDIASGAKTVASVIRSAMVDARVYGDETALRVGDISNDSEIIELLEYAASSSVDGMIAGGVASVTAPTAPRVPIALLGAPTAPVAPRVPIAPLGTAPTTAPRVPIAPIGSPTTATIPVAARVPIALLGTPDADRLNRLDDLNGQLSLARSAWAKLSAKRQRHAFGRESSDYLAAEAEYQRLSREVARTELHDQLAAEPLLVNKYAMVDAHWVAEQNKLREESKKSLEGRKIWKFADKFSKWLNRGPLAWRIAKSAMLGITAGAVVFALGAGTVGAAGLALGTRFGRGYATRVTGGIDQLDDETKADVSRQRSLLGVGATDDDILTGRANTYDAKYDADGDKLRKRRRGTILRAGTLAVAGYVGGSLLHNIFGGGHNSISKGTSGGGNTGGNSGGNLGAQPGGAAGDFSGSGVGNHSGPGLGDHQPASDGDIPKPGVDGQSGAAPADLGHGLLNPEATFNVHSGEGWYETFKDMGIPKDKWANVLKDAGPKLHKLGAAYFNQAHGEWRIASPGTLKVDSLQAIADSSAKFGYAFSKIG